MLHADVARAFQERARTGQVCVGIHTSAMSPQLVELYGITGADFVIIGSEVESLDMGRMEDMIRAADAARTVPIVKLRRPDPNLIGEVMNAGAPMVMVPHVTNRELLDLMVRAAKFEPEGLRGECPISRYNGYGALRLAEVHDVANSSRPIIPILEDADALDHLDEMMESEDVDIFEVGPFDLSRSLGETGQGYLGTKTMAALDKICAAAQRHGKAVLAPIWHAPKLDSYPAIIQQQMDELIARGINCVYELETGWLAAHMTRMGILRKVRVVEDEPAKPARSVKAPPRAPKKAPKPKAQHVSVSGKRKSSGARA